MIRYIFALLLVSAGVVQAADSGATSGAPAPKPLSESRPLSAEEKTAENLLAEYFVAYDQQDSRAMRKLVLSGRAFTRVASRHAKLGWSNYDDERLVSDFGTLGKTKSAVSLLSFDRVTNGAYVVFRNDLEIRQGPQPERLEMLGSAYLETTGSHWFIRHIHTSAPLQIVQQVDVTPEERKHPIRDVGEYKQPPSVELTVTQDDLEGWNLQLATNHFKFVPERAGAPYLKGQGHLQLYVDDQKVARIYGNWFHIGDLSPGRHKIKVVLTGTDHSVLANKGKVIASEVEVQQSQQVADR